jgi:predicted MFS family arabinose efflux permease
MAGGSLLGGLLLLAWSQIGSLWALYPLMAGIGLAQAMNLYEPAFAVIVRRVGTEARQGITTLTLWGGFASTVFVPLIQFLLDHRSWRETLMILGLIMLAVCVPLHLAVIGQGRPTLPAPPGDAAPLQGRLAVRWAIKQPVFWALAVTFTFYYGIFSGLTYHLYPLLLEGHFDTATVVGTIAIIGPAQVGSRIVMWLSGAHRSIRAIGVVTVAALPVAVLLLMVLPSAFASLAIFAALLGGANGIMTILRGVSVPEMLTREAYGAINGALAVPSTIARAISPLAAALLWSATGTYDAVLIVALAGFGCSAAAFWFAAARAAPGG